MATEKIVKCFVQKKDVHDALRTARYVPLDIFNLWKFLMEKRHMFDVSDRVSLLYFFALYEIRFSHGWIPVRKLPFVHSHNNLCRYRSSGGSFRETRNN